MNNRTTPTNITELKENEIFVFGSNAQGDHAGGAAKFAKEKLGAEQGAAKGRTGNCYAIDTMSGLDVIKEQIQPFIETAKILPLCNFLVTEIGCGIAGYTAEQIAPLFEEVKAIENIYLPESFWKIILAEKKLTTYKGFNADLKCRDFQYEIGNEYEHNGKVKACASGFHACENPFDVWKYYPPTNGNRFCETEQSGDIKTHSDDSKVASKKIKIKAEIGFKGLIDAAVKFIFEKTMVADPQKSTSATSGKYSNSATSGDNSIASCKDTSIAAAIGKNSKAEGGLGCWIVVSEWNQLPNYEWEIVGVQSAKVDGEIIKADTCYILKNGQLMEVE